MKKSLTRRSFLGGAAIASAASRSGAVHASPLHYPQPGPSPPGRPFLLTATVAFPDDCSEVVFTEALLEHLLERMKWMGVRRVYWEYYGDMTRGYWATAIRRPAQGGATGVNVSGIHPMKQTLLNLGEPPINVGARVARKLGLEFYAIIKPYEAGHSTSEPWGSPRRGQITGLPRIGGISDRSYPWTVRHPEFRLRARERELPRGLDGIAVEAIQLRKLDNSAHSLRAKHLEIWTSANNYDYRRVKTRFTVRESVETCLRDVFDINGGLVTSKGAKVRALTLQGLKLTDPFIAITTNSPSRRGSFRNTALEMVRAFAGDGKEIPIVVASHRAVWGRVRNFRTGGLEFDGGIGAIPVTLDVDNRLPNCTTCSAQGRADCMGAITLYPEFPLCRDGLVAFARGRNAYYSGGLCEAYPEVQDYWLDWIGECLAAGVDGLDIRISNHSTWSDYMDLYGFNEPVAAEYERRYGVNPNHEPYDTQLLADLRGDFYDQFLTKAKQKLSAAGKKLQLHIEVESFRPDAAPMRVRTRPGNTTFHWRRWIDSGLADEATLMPVSWGLDRVLKDSLTDEILSYCQKAGVPLYVRNFMWNSRDGQFQGDQLERVFRQGGYSGYNFYETASFYNFKKTAEQGRLVFFPGMVEGIQSRARQLDLI